MVTLGLLAGVIFGFALFARRIEGTVVTAAMIFVSAGLVAAWTGIVDLGSATHGTGVAHEVVLITAELALVLLLFTDAARIDLRALRGNVLPVRLLAIGLPVTIGLAIIAWVAADEVGGNGFIAAFVGGGAASIAAGPVIRRVLDFTEEEGELLNLAVFFLFGVFAADVLGDASWQIVAYALLSLTVIRMLPVAISVIGLGLRPATIGFLGWFGPRGLASIILALVVVEEEPGLQGIDEIFLVMTVTVLLSVFAHGLSAAPLSRRYARLTDSVTAGSPEHETVVELPTRWSGTGTEV